MAKNDSKPLPAFLAKDIARFWAKVDRRGPDDCWLWTAGAYPEGYGKFGSGGRTLASHRIALFLGTGIEPAPLHACHKCDVRYAPDDITYRLCCNPDHLFAGSPTDNMRDASKKGRMATGDRHGNNTTPESRPRGEKHKLSKLTDESVLQIRSLYRLGFTQDKLAEYFGVTQGLVGMIVRRKIWRHLP